MSAIAARNLLLNNRDNNPNHLPPIGKRPSTTSQQRSGGSASPGAGSADHRQKGLKPQLLVCYLCGQQFGTSSLIIHMPQCYGKKLIEWERGEPGKRGPRPKDPATVDLSAMPTSRDEFNNQQFSHFTENLAQCPNCGRKFLADRLEVHLRSCKPGASGASKPVKGKELVRGNSASPQSRGGASRFDDNNNDVDDENDDQDRRRKGEKPQLLVCYLCGQQFGSSSLTIHMPQCYSKKMKEWDRGEPGKRGPKPKDPATVDLSAMPKSRDEFNNQQFSQFAENLAQCPNCGRKFLADRLEVHLRSCKPGASGASKPVKGKEFSPSSNNNNNNNRPSTSSSRFNNGKEAQEEDDDDDDSPSRRKGEKPMFLVCYLCGQQFGTSSLTIHMPQCYVKKLIEWERGDPDRRGPRPKDPATVELSAMPRNRQEFNDQQFTQFTDNLVPCENCGRKFAPDRLEVHLRSCKPGASGASKPVKGKNQHLEPTGGGGGGGGGGSSSSPSPSARPSSTSNQKQQQPRNQNENKNLLPPKLRSLRQLLIEEIKDASLHKVTTDFDQLSKMLQQIDSTVSISDIEKIFDSLDENQDGVVDANEWSFASKELGIVMPSSSSSSSTRNNNKNTNTNNNRNNPLTNRLPSPQKSASPTANDDMMFCDECSAKIPASSKFCPSCGGKIEDLDNDNDNDNNEQEQQEDDYDNDNDNDIASSANLGMLCEECGEIFEEGTKFCEECGGELKPLVPTQHSQSVLKHSTVTTSNQNNYSQQQQNEEEEGVEQQQQQQYSRPTPPPPPPSSGIGVNFPKHAPTRRNFEKQADEDYKKSYAYKSDHFEEGDEYSDNNNPQGEDENRVSCSICGRKFNPEAIARHEKICEKASSRTRRVFDSSKMRATGEMKQVARASVGPKTYASTNNTNKQQQQQSPTSSRGGNNNNNSDVPKWKRESESFRNAMKQAREVSVVLAKGGTAKDLPPPTYSENAHYKQCPYCSRRFAPEVADRHIPKCKTTMNKPKPPPKRRF